MKRYDAWSESDPQCGFGGGRCELYERTLGSYVTFDDHERATSELTTERDRLAAENAELRGKLDDVRMGIGCARGQRSTQYCADLTQRDEVIRRLLAMLKPGEKPKEPCPSASTFEHQCASIRRKLWMQRSEFHARAIAIAEGRDNG